MEGGIAARPLEDQAEDDVQGIAWELLGYLYVGHFFSMLLTNRNREKIPRVLL